jgi:hypothetical protein
MVSFMRVCLHQRVIVRQKALEALGVGLVFFPCNQRYSDMEMVLLDVDLLDFCMISPVDLPREHQTSFGTQQTSLG